MLAIHQDRADSRTRVRDQTHSYWYIPSAPRENYSLLVMESAEMMKMATGEGFPPLAGCRNGSRLVFSGKGGFWRRNSRSRFLSGSFSIYKRFWRREQVRGGLRAVHEVGGEPLGAPPTLVGSSGLFWPNSFTPWPSSGTKISSIKFQVNWTPFGFPFLRYSKTRKK